MKEHIKRKYEYLKDAIPDETDAGYAELIAYHKKRLENPQEKKMIKDKFKKAIKTLEVQSMNGISLNMDFELREYLREFNHRSWTYGHRKMPLMFNIMEAFFNLDKTINYWELLEEEDYMFSFYDFLDFYTSQDINYNKNLLIEHFEENLIYNYNVGVDLSEITFKTTNKNEFVISGVSIIRKGNEIVMLFQTGQIIDTKIKTSELKPLPKSKIPGKEKIKPSKYRKREAVKLNEDENLWKTLIACRFDLETETIDARYVAKDEGNSYSIITDDITGFKKENEWLIPELEETYKNMLSEIETYNPIFELAKAVLFLPYYFNTFEEKIEEENHETKFKEITNSPFKKRKYNIVNPKYKIRNRSLWILNINNKFSSNKIVIRDDKFRIQNKGYWKKLTANEIGIDKKGNKVTGKTWVNITESYFQAKSDELIITNKPKKFENKNAGDIYIMRNPTFGKSIFKIGLTTKTTKERAQQLSKTSVADNFYVINEWNVKDCFKAEKEIHKALDKYRVDPRREFFKIDLIKAQKVINEIIDKINNV